MILKSSQLILRFASSYNIKFPIKRTISNFENNKNGNNLDISFTDTTSVYETKTTLEIFRAWFVLKLCSINFIIEKNEKIMKWSERILGKKIFNKLMKMTVYGHFVGGENLSEVEKVIDRLDNSGISAILDYSVEEDLTKDEAVKAEMESCLDLDRDYKFSKELASSMYKLIKSNEVYRRRFVPQIEFGDRREGVKSARTYFYSNEITCDRNMEHFLETIEVASKSKKTALRRSTEDHFAVIKITALVKPKVLMQISDGIVRFHHFIKIQLNQHPKLEEELSQNQALLFQEKNEIFKWVKSLSKDLNHSRSLLSLIPYKTMCYAYHLDKEKAFKIPEVQKNQLDILFPNLTEDDDLLRMNMFFRLRTIFEAAEKSKVRVMVDAEQSYFQPAIARLTMKMMREFNKERPIVQNTYQTYLKKAAHYFRDDLREARHLDFFFGAKIVRGAYLSQERSRAEHVKYKDPTNQSFEETTKMLEQCIILGLERIAKGRKISIIVASHNEDTIRFSLDKIKEYGIDYSETPTFYLMKNATGGQSVGFAQLYGMSDNITFPLGQHGFSVFKYVPYGEIGQVLPYLSRRLKENPVTKKTKNERKMLFRELIRRISSFQFKSANKILFNKIQ